MKTATILAVRVGPELRTAVESVLSEGETLSQFVEASVRASVERRRVQAEFIARGLRARDAARATGDYVDADMVVAGLQRKLDAARASLAPARKTYRHTVRIDFSRPGKPTDNRHVETFNGSLRDECLNVHWFASMPEARASIEAWRQDCNEGRPHMALGNESPSDFARQSRHLPERRSALGAENQRFGRSEFPERIKKSHLSRNQWSEKSGQVN